MTARKGKECIYKFRKKLNRSWMSCTVMAMKLILWGDVSGTLFMEDWGFNS